MDLWLDNTGLHSAGYALEGKAQGEVDARGLLQLAALLAFSNHLSVNSFESGFIASYSRDVISALRELGLEAGVIEFSGVTEADYWRACEITSARIAEDVNYGFQPDESSIIGLDPSGLPVHAENARTSFKYLLVNEPGPAELDGIVAEAKYQRATGAVVFMVASNPTLRAAIKARKSTLWSDHESHQFSAYARCQLNYTLASTSKSQYTPAVARASFLRRRNDFLVLRPMSKLDNIAQDLRGTPLPFPSLAAALLHRSRGEPKALIQEAIVLREKTHNIRAWLHQKAQSADVTTSKGKFKVDLEFREFLLPLEQALGLTGKPRLRDALEIGVDMGLPSAGISPSAILNWAAHQWDKRQINVLTDLSIDAAFGDVDAASLRSFVFKCGGQ